MSRFTFRFESVLRLHEAARDERRALLADALGVEAELLSRQQQLDDSLRANRESMTPRPGNVQLDRLVDAERYALVLGFERQQLTLQLNAVAKEIDERRQALVEADRELRVWEKLRETEAARWADESRRGEQRQLDEWAGIGHERHRREGRR